MMNPFSMAAVGVGSTIAGGGLKAFGDILGGQSQSAMYSYQAGVARTNAVIAEQNANYAIQKGEIEAQKSGMATRFREGEITAGQAGSGLDVNKGSAVLVRSGQQTVGNFDQAILRSNAAKEAYGYRVQGLMDRSQATVDDYAAAYSKRAGYMNAASSILGTIGSVASKWTQGQSVGLTPGGAGLPSTDTSGTDWG